MPVIGPQSFRSLRNEPGDGRPECLGKGQESEADGQPTADALVVMGRHPTEQPSERQVVFEKALEEVLPEDADILDALAEDYGGVSAVLGLTVTPRRLLQQTRE